VVRKVVAAPVELDPIVKWRRGQEAKRHAEKVEKMREAAILRREAEVKLAHLNEEAEAERTSLPFGERIYKAIRVAEAEGRSTPLHNRLLHVSVVKAAAQRDGRIV
jgi:regulator of protease activity HflC (stomatin/prohibitin superfamily)